ncbi:hypothetical protein QR680_016399 [Steinernema hermaphroditum]|uniref:AMP-dependent synthetase/ligase domain-containing protein n=1 Tax=Steinernema hermaphroditum TaxID=289476 RepID=A0AA39HC77_9BILA|nr:hypothetical protein QR680_016399 [Steinernema hermaphroditum]
MTRVHSKFRILSVSRCLSTERISPSRIRCAIEEVKESIGQKKGKLIGIAIEKCPLAVVLMLGILESGNAFIFIPSEAESYVQVLCKRFKVNRLIRRCEMPNSERISVDSNVLWVKRCSDFRMPWNSPISYAIQTSGTTGKPKTVHVTWDCIYANISDFRDRFFVTDSDVILQLTSLTFDPSMVEILLAAETGAELVIFTEDIGLPTLSAQPALLAKLISQIRPTFLQMTPSCLVQLKHDFLADLLGPRSAVRVLILGGEAFPLNLVNSVRSPENRTRVFNVYGVTEVSCWASVQEIGFGEKKICAGEPIIDTELLIDDVEVVIDGKRFCFVDFGMEKAIPHRTGDLGHYSNGEIVVIGRNKPNAILPSTEVEDLVLKEFSQVLLAKIVFDRNFAVLFYKSEEHLDSEIMEAIVAHLPSNKRPGLVCHVDDWPVTKNGKVDDEALLLEARKQIQLESSDSVKSIFKEYGVSLEEDKEETFQNLGFTSLQATELLFKLAPLIEEEMVGEVHRLLLSDEGKVADLLKVLDYGSLKDSERKASVSDLQLVEEENSCELLWESDLKKCIDASPVVLDGLVFIGSHAGIFTVVNLETGEVKLRLNVEGRIEKTCGFCEKYVAFGTYKGKLYVLDRSSLEMSAVFNVGEEVIKCTPVFDKSNKLYCGSHDRQLVKFNIEDNSVDYRVPVNGAIVSTPLLLNNETLAVATLNGFVYLVDQARTYTLILESHPDLFRTPAKSVQRRA